MKTITVKGIGTAAVKPDLVVLSLSLTTLHIDYESSMRDAADKVEALNRSLSSLGFEKDSAKTTDFDINAEYVSKKDKNGNYYREFQGYKVTHEIKVSFDFDTKILSRVLSTIALCTSEPELSVRFTVKDPSAVRDLLLQNAADNACRKAKVLCAALDTELGEIISIDYNWGEVNIYSPTRYRALEDYCCASADAINIDIEPDDVSATDTVTFVWEIH